LDPLRNVEDGNDLGMALDQRSQARLLLADALIAIQINANRSGFGLNGMLDGATQHGIVDRPSVVADISFVDPNDGHRMLLVRVGGPEADESVVQQQIDRFADPGCGQSAKEQCCGSQDAALE
jgi:hypothetical protein